MIFKKADGTSTGDVAKYIKEYLAKQTHGEFKIFIGCDSLPPRKKVTTFAIVIVIYNVGKGGHVIHKRLPESSREFRVMWNRLWREVELAVATAMYIRDSKCLDIPKSRQKMIQVDFAGLHIDINPDKKWRSNEVFSAAIGYVKGMGFEYHAKPDAPAASYAADHICRM